MERFERLEPLIGADGIEKLKKSRVAVCGLGGVGCAAAEALARCGIGKLTLCDCDEYEASNLNRQLFATEQTLGQRKTAAASERLLSIDSSIDIAELDMRLCAQNIDRLFETRPDFIIDAVDDVTAKLLIIETAIENEIPFISSMGTGNRLDATGFRLGTIEQTAGCGCGLARVMRRELKKRGIERAPVLYSVLPPLETAGTVGSISFVPPVAGFLLAQAAVTKLLEEK